MWVVGHGGHVCLSPCILEFVLGFWHRHDNTTNVQYIKAYINLMHIKTININQAQPRKLKRKVKPLIKLTNTIRHLIPAEVKVRRVGLNHGCGTIKWTHLLIGTEVYKKNVASIRMYIIMQKFVSLPYWISYIHQWEMGQVLSGSNYMVNILLLCVVLVYNYHIKHCKCGLVWL